MKVQSRKVIEIVESGLSTDDLLEIQTYIGREVAKRTLFRGVAAKTDWWTCTACGRSSYGPETHGYRAMDDGTIRAQAQCKRCRSTSHRRSHPAASPAGSESSPR